jgi:CBS domain-containing protein
MVSWVQESFHEVIAMKVADIMTKKPVVVFVDDPVRKAAGLMKENNIGGLPVMDGDELAGIITDSDIMGLLETGDISDDLWLPSPLEIIEVPVREIINWEKTKKALTHIGDQKVEKVMSSPPITIGPSADIEEAAALMLHEKIARLPVIENRKLIGIVTRADIVHGIGSVYPAPPGGSRE